MKHINTYILSKIKNETNITEKLKISKTQKYTLFPETKNELRDMIKKEIKQNGNNCSLNHIDVSKITDMYGLFYNDDIIEKFNGDISQWDVSNVTDMSFMFMYSLYRGTYGSISQWDVSNVENMVGMFKNSVFNNDISEWDVCNVKDMSFMFQNSVFNQDISNWDASTVRNMNDMFNNSAFNKDISNWKINPKCKVKDMFYKCNILPEFKPKAIL